MRTLLLATAAIIALAHIASAAILPIANYSMENGQSGFTTYHDDTYNGAGNPNADGSFLSGGTGQLTDGVLGTDDIFNNGVFDWVGWFSIQPLIVFDLGAESVLNSLSLRAANNSSIFNDVAVFGEAAISFSHDGVNFYDLFLFISSDADRTGNASRWVNIPIVNETARYVRAELFDGVKVGE